MNGINFCMYINFFINAVFQVTVHLYDFKLDQTVKKKKSLCWYILFNKLHNSMPHMNSHDWSTFMEGPCFWF